VESAQWFAQPLVAKLLLTRLFTIRLEKISKLLIPRALEKVTKFVISPVLCFLADERIHFAK